MMLTRTAPLWRRPRAAHAHFQQASQEPDDRPDEYRAHQRRADQTRLAQSAKRGELRRFHGPEIGAQARNPVEGLVDREQWQFDAGNALSRRRNVEPKLAIL